MQNARRQQQAEARNRLALARAELREYLPGLPGQKRINDSALERDGVTKLLAVVYSLTLQ